MTTKIEWTDETWNPTRGCSRVSPGCENCYAERVAPRAYGADEYTRRTASGPRWTGTVRLIPEMLPKPLRWRRPRKIFVNSMSDLFHESLPDEAIMAVFGVMALARRHTFQVLTKRADRMRRWFQMMAKIRRGPLSNCLANAYVAHPELGDVQPLDGDLAFELADAGWPLPNVWLGVSAEDQDTAAARIPHLLRTPARIRFVSLEPLLGPIDLCSVGGYDALDGIDFEDIGDIRKPNEMPGARPPEVQPLHWVIVGSESGPSARATCARWVQSLRDQCRATGAAFFFKQWGEWAPAHQQRAYDWHPTLMHPTLNMCRVGKKRAGRKLDGRTWDEFPINS